MASISKGQCPHVTETTPDARAESSACVECGLDSPTRICMTCGHVGCCESMNGHATAHAHANHHPIIRSLPLSDSSFTWCYECNAYLN